MPVAVHKVEEGSSRYKRITAHLYVGPNPKGPRGGLCGNVVDAVCVARGKAAESPYISGLPEHVLVALHDHFGRPINYNDLFSIPQGGALAVLAWIAASKSLT